MFNEINEIDMMEINDKYKVKDILPLIYGFSPHLKDSPKQIEEEYKLRAQNAERPSSAIKSLESTLQNETPKSNEAGPQEYRKFETPKASGIDTQEMVQKAYGREDVSDYLNWIEENVHESGYGDPEFLNTIIPYSLKDIKQGIEELMIIIRG